jgi:superfamily II DNA or RNA helicase
MATKSLKIEGMTCAACAKAVERAAKKLEGVTEANVNYATEKLNISYDDGLVSVGDIQTAVEIGELVPIRCIRVKTNVDLSNVRINGIKYNSQELESKMFEPERNKIILDTWLEYVKDKKTVIFCASIKHAEEVADLFKAARVAAKAISGVTRTSLREKILNDYEKGDTNVLCACDLLNEGWDSPKTQVLFMARPTMSRP